MEILVRKATLNDFNIFLEIRKQSWLYAYSHIFGKQNIIDHFQKKYTDKEYLERHKSAIEHDETHFVACANNLPVAIMMINLGVSKDMAEITCLYCHPTFMRMGIGKKLFDYAKALFKKNNKKAFIINALKDNPIGCNFYKKLGGKKINEFEKVLCNQQVKTVTFEFNI